MTYAPKTLLDARAFIIARMGVPAASVGIVGDAAHLGGYHCGSDRLVPRDYSVHESPRDKKGLTQAASAIDIGQFQRGSMNLKHFSNWLVKECKKGTSDTADIREVIYSPDGRTVRRWDRLGLRSSGDDSHLWHTHVSYFRDSERRDKTALFKRYVGETMELSDKVKVPSWAQERWEDLGKTITVETALASGYSHARSAKDHAVKALTAASEAVALSAAILEVVKSVAGGGVDPQVMIDAARAGAAEALSKISVEITSET